jgi:hypothetical protein
VPRDCIELEDRRVGEIVDGVDTRHVGHARAAPDIDEDARRLQEALADPDEIRTLEARVPFDQGKTVHAAQPFLDAGARVVRDRVGPGFHPRHVDPDRTLDRDPIVGAPPGKVGGVRAGDQCLGWDAAGVDAGSTDQIPLDDCNLHPGCGQAPGQGWSRLSGTDDDGIEELGHGTGPR